MVVDEDLDPGAHHSTQASLSVRHKWENRSWVNNTLRQAPGVRVNSRARLIRFPRCLTTPVPPVCYTSKDPNSSTLGLGPCYTPMIDDWLHFAVALVSVRQFVGNTVLYELQLVRQRRSIMQLGGWRVSCVRKQPKQKKIDDETAQYKIRLRRNWRYKSNCEWMNNPSTTSAAKQKPCLRRKGTVASFTSSGVHLLRVWLV